MFKTLFAVVTYYKALYKLANNYEQELVKKCNEMNGKLAKEGMADNPAVKMSQHLANTIFVDTHKNIFTEIKRIFDIDKKCKQYGLEEGIYIYFRRPNMFIRMGRALTYVPPKA